MYLVEKSVYVVLFSWRIKYVQGLLEQVCLS